MQELLKTREFWISMLTPIVAIIVSLVPSLQEVRTEIISVLVVVAVTLVGSLTLQRASENALAGKRIESDAYSEAAASYAQAERYRLQAAQEASVQKAPLIASSAQGVVNGQEVALIEADEDTREARIDVLLVLNQVLSDPAVDSVQKLREVIAARALQETYDIRFQG